MASKNEDVIPDRYKYFWTAQSELPLQDFLSKYRPSMVQNDGTKPWIWVSGSEPSKKNSQSSKEAAVEEATKLLMEVTEKVENIKNDETIPIRSNKKTGAKSKKELREQVQAEATETLKNIALKHGHVNGKWLIFAPTEKVDAIWSSIAMSLVSGPLHSTSAYLAKVSTSSEDENSRGQHLICIYLPDVYDKPKVTEAMKVLLRNHGATLSGVKADLYTVIGIDSKHPSGISSTIWKNAAVIPEKEAKELKDIFFAELTAKPAAAAATDKAPEVKPSSGDGAASTSNAQHGGFLKKPAPKPKLKKKAVSDPFGSSDDDSDDDSEGAKDDSKEAPKASKKAPVPKAKRAQEDNEDEDDERPKKKRVVKK